MRSAKIGYAKTSGAGILPIIPHLRIHARILRSGKELGIMSGQQQTIESNADKMQGDELDKALHECMSVIWKSYRESVTTGNAKPFNACFSGLYEKYTDDAVQRFIQCTGMGLVQAVNRRLGHG